MSNVITQKTLPGLRWFFGSFRHQTGDSSLRDCETEFQKFSVDSWCAPEWIGGGHGSHQLPNLRTHYRTPWPFGLRQPPPILFESFTLPSDDRFWSNNRQCGLPIFPDGLQRNPKQAVSSMQLRTFHASLEDRQLLAECRIFQCDMLVTTEHKD